MYRSYLAGPRESRFASQWVREQDRGWLWDIAWAVASRYCVTEPRTR